MPANVGSCGDWRRPRRSSIVSRVHRGIMCAMPKLIDLSGQRFGELTVLHLADIKLKGRPAWVCRCDCGLTKVARSEHLKNGDARSCGTHKTKRFIESLPLGSQKKRLYPPGTDTRSRLYTLWRAMLWRCTDPSHEAYGRYGGRGITVCEEWRTFGPFRLWALQSGYANDLTIDRIDNDKGYSPSNCRWATPKAQALNRRFNVRLTAFGETRLLVDWAADPRCVVTAAQLRKRLANGQPPEFAVTATESEARHRAATLREAAKRSAP